jgi:uncharacterized protein
MPINAHPDYLAAEKRYLEAQTDEERIFCLEDMIRKAPSHKGAENLRAELKLRLKKLKEKILKAKKSGKSTKESIRKGDMQATIIGLTNSGKSSLLNTLTNANSLVQEYLFTTTKPEIGTMFYERVNIQIIDLPSIGSDNFDSGIVNTTDTILEVVEKIEDVEKVNQAIISSKAKKIVVLNKSDLLSEEQKRKVNAYLRSKRYDFVIISTRNNEGIEELKEKIFLSFDIIRVFTKQPGKEPTKTPIILKPGSTIKDVAKKISNELLKNLTEIRIWGPSSKFGNQKVGINHQLKDKDIVEFRTR